MTEPAESIQLLLDEMFSPMVAEALRERGHKVVALVEKPEMRFMSDEEVDYSSGRSSPDNCANAFLNDLADSARFK